MFRKIKLRKILSWIGGIYVVLGGGLYLFQKKFIFHPDILPADYKFSYDLPFEEIRIPINDKELLSAVLFKAQSPRGIMLYFHGNARNISKYGKKTADFVKQGYDVLMMDYPTYGKSTGTLSEAAMYADALHMYEIARKRFSPDSIIIYGRSLGTGVAAQLASVRDCRQLVLEAPYYNITDMAKRLIPIYPYSIMLDYKFPTNEYLPEVTAPITILHGTEDRTIPIASGKKLEKFLKPGDRFITIEGAGHRDLDDYPLYHKTLDSVLH